LHGVEKERNKLWSQGAVQKDRNRRTCPDFTSGAKRELTRIIAEKCIDFQLSAALLVFAHYLCGKNIALFGQPPDVWVFI
jgi:hypothetical protein